VNAALEVMLEHKLLGQPSWRQLPITVGEYFDPDYASSDDELDIDDVPLHDHAVRYLDVSNSLVETTRLTLLDNKTCKKRTIVETFWNGGCNRIIERRDQFCGVEEYWEMIIDVQLTADPLTVEIMRVGRNAETMIIYSHSIITDNADGSQTEVKIYPKD
jgi:hypothetical protein